MTLLTMIAVGVAGAALTFVGGAVFYVLGSYAISAFGDAAPRSLRLTISEMIRELVLTILIQPLLPLFYFVGRRLAGGEGTPIVAVHGYMQNRVDFVGLAARLRRGGLGPVYGFNYPWYRSTHENAARLARFIDGVLTETKKARVALVCHSMGGLVALEYLLHHDGGQHVTKCVTIASPHAGIVYRGPLFGAAHRELRSGSELVLSLVGRAPVPVLSIASSHDNIAHPPTISALVERGGVDHVVDGPGHLAILFDRRVSAEVVAFLREDPKAPTVESARDASHVPEDPR